MFRLSRFVDLSKNMYLNTTYLGPVEALQRGPKETADLPKILH